MIAARDPYAEIATAYDAEFDAAEADCAGYTARGMGGPVLVLGCGTGRVCRALAQTRPVTGIDLSSPMIARAIERGPSTIDYRVGDMRSFNAGRFAEIFIPNASFAFLRSRADRSACLSACRRASDGPLTIDLPMPDFSLLGTPHTPEREAWRGLIEGGEIVRTREVFREPVAGTLRLLDRYYVGETCTISELLLHLHTPAELEWMLEANGYYADAMFGDHAGGPIREGCDRLLVVARPIS